MSDTRAVSVVVTGGTLFHLAARHLSSPLEWHRIAVVNRLSDPWLAGLATLHLPAADPSDTSGLPDVR